MVAISPRQREAEAIDGQGLGGCVRDMKGSGHTASCVD